MKKERLGIAAGVLAALLAGCGGSHGLSAVPPASVGADAVAFDRPLRRLVHRALSGKIAHIVIIMQENQSFDHLFNGYPGANTVQSGKTHTGQMVSLLKQNLGAPTNTSHYSVDFLNAYDGGRMDGFDLNSAAPSPNLLAYTYVNPAQIKPYYQLAQQYVLADNFFTSHIDASLVAHQYIIAAQAGHAVNLPTGSWGCAGGVGDSIPTLKSDRSVGPFEPVCFDYTTLADEIDAAGLTWHFYAPQYNKSGGSWSSYQAVSHIYNGPDWKADVISPQTRILQDVPNGILANVTWVVPDNAHSDHPGSQHAEGPAWVASIVNAIGQSKFWNSTEIFVTWDEWGGEYDHVAPPHKDYDGDGFRVPLLCISPYAYQGQVNKTQLETTSILKFVEQTFGLAALTAADNRATSADSGCTNPQQSQPRKFVPITADRTREQLLREPPSDEPIDEDGGPSPASFAPTTSVDERIDQTPMARLLRGDAGACTGSAPPRGSLQADSTSGTLFVSNFAGNTIQEFDAAGTNQNPLGSIVNAVNRPYGVSVGSDGTVWVANYNANDVLGFPQGASNASTVLSQLVLAPLVAATDPQGNVYVIDDRGGPILIFPPGATSNPTQLGGFRYPTDLAFDKAGDLFIVDHAYANQGAMGSVFEYPVGSHTRKNLGLLRLDYPVGIAIDSQGDLTISNLGNNTITEYAPGATTPKRTIGGINGALCDPVYLAYTAGNILYVVSNKGSPNGYVTGYKPGTTRPFVTLTADMVNPRGVAVNPNWQPPR